MTHVGNKDNIARMGFDPHYKGRHYTYFSACSPDTEIPSVRPRDPCAIGRPVVTPYPV